MRKEKWLDEALRQIRFFPDRKKVRKELEEHLEDRIDEYAEVVAVVTYEGKFSADERLNKNAVIRRYISEDEYYQAIIMAYKSNPLKWTTSGSAVSDNLQTIKFSPEMIKKTGKKNTSFCFFKR